MIRLEYPLDLDSKRELLAGSSLRELADVPFERLGRFSHYLEGDIRGEISLWPELDDFAGAAAVWALMQTDLHGGSVECHRLGAGDALFMSALRYWCEQPDVLVTATFAYDDLRSVEPPLDGQYLLDRRLGNSAVVYDPAAVPLQSLGDTSLITVADSGEFVPTPAPGAVAAAAEQPESRPVMGASFLVVNRRFVVHDSPGRVSVRDNAVEARRMSILAGLSHRAAAERSLPLTVRSQLTVHVRRQDSPDSEVA